MLQWFFKNYFSWAYLQLAAHKLMTCLGLSKSDWFGHSCKDQHDVWSRTDPWLTSNQYLLSICVAGVFRRGIVVLRGCILPKSPSPGKTGQHVETRPLGPSSVKAATFSNPMITYLPSMWCVLSPSFRAGKTRLPSCINSLSYLQAVVPNANSIPQTYWSWHILKSSPVFILAARPLQPFSSEWTSFSPIQSSRVGSTTSLKRKTRSP